MKRVKLFEQFNNSLNEVKMVKAKRGHNYYQLHRDTPIKYISGNSGMGLKVSGVLLHNEYDTIMGKEGAYIIDYFGQHFYVDMKNKFATSIVNPNDDEQDKDLMRNMVRADIAPDHSSWKKYLNESMANEAKVNKGKVHKAAKEASYPVTLVVVDDKGVCHQELVNTPMEVPAAVSVLKDKYPSCKIQVESKTGEVVFVQE